MKMRRLYSVGAALISLLIVDLADAGTITVQNLSDSGAGSLRQALADANNGDTINFSVTGTITLVSGQLVVDKSLTITGPGANLLTLNANGFRGINVSSSAMSVTIYGLTITNGNAPGDVGGDINNNSPNLTVSNCTVSYGSAVRGAGLFNQSGQVTVISSTFIGNAGVDGGGMGNVGVAIVKNSTFSGNSAGDVGGGIRNDATLTVSNCTFSGNSAVVTPGGFVGGGAIDNLLGSLDLAGTVLTQAGAKGQTIRNGNATFVSHGYNLSSDAAGGDGTTGPGGLLNSTGDVRNTDPKLGRLAYYGGPTPTHILLTGSPAIDAGDPNFSPPPATDQRGFARVVNARIDIGAFERQPNDIDPTLVVTTTADTNTNNTCDPASPCSLRDAITAANSSAPDDAIYFAVTGTITLNSLGALPALNSNMKILGPAANALTVKRDSAAANFRIFTVNSGKTVTISGLTITNGHARGSFPNDSGGGIYNDHATLMVSNCTVSGNSGGEVGGGIYNNGSGGGATLTINNSTLSGNSAGTVGGGIHNDGEGGSGTLTIINSTFSGNSATSSGGGILSDGSGGGATVTINNCTFSGNSDGHLGGGIYNDFSSSVTIGSTIFNASSIDSPNGIVISQGYNLSSDNLGGYLNQATDQNNTDPMLGPLQDNGGPTLTQAIDCNSPALNKGSNPDAYVYDQRGPGFARTVGAGTDIGAFELQTICNTPPTITAGTGISRVQGGGSSNSQIATVHDNEDPPSALTVTVNGGASATVNGVTVSNIAIDASGHVTADVVASCSASNASFTLRVTDSGGLFSEATLTVSVTANQAPVITVPKTVDATAQKKKVNGQFGAFVFFNVSAVDLEDGPVPAVASPPSGSFFPVGATTVTVTATDHCGNTSTTYFAVTVAKKKKRHAPF